MKKYELSVYDCTVRSDVDLWIDVYKCKGLGKCDTFNIYKCAENAVKKSRYYLIGNNIKNILINMWL